LERRLHGTGQTQLSHDTGNDYNPSWSPDGSKISFDGSNPNSQIYVMNPDGSSETTITNGTADEFPEYSHDGSKIAFERDIQIFIMNADGSSPVSVTDGTHMDGRPTWSPDDKKLAFTNHYNSYDTLYTINVDGTSRTQITFPPSFDSDPDWR
jgi:Tol biopolymer transport system component